MENVSRRRVLQAVVVLGGGVGLSGWLGEVPALAAVQRDQLRRSVFSPRIDRTFTFRSPTRVFRAKLVEVTDLPWQPAGHERRFRLLFQVASPRMPEGGTYTVTAQGVRLRMFVSPVGQTSDWFEAIVSS